MFATDGSIVEVAAMMSTLRWGEWRVENGKWIGGVACDGVTCGATFG
jgi:hypothetical protein